jgi:hypothetical protein
VRDHLQLIWQSVAAPRAAADHAGQNPNTYKLGWTYVGLLTLATFALELLVRQNFPQNYAPDPEAPASLLWFDNVWAATTMTAAIYAVSYLVLRWFWRRVADESIVQPAIDAAVAVSFACSLALLPLQYVLFEMNNEAAMSLQVLSWILPMIAGLVLTSFSFSQAFHMPWLIAFGYNAMFNAIVLVTVICIIIVSVVVIWLATGNSLESLFETGATAP